MSRSRQSPATTATTASSSSSSAFDTSTLNDIDGDDSYVRDDDYDDEESNVSDLDSILAMAKRLDDASIISDPSIIEGTTPHINIGGKTYGGRGVGVGGASQYRASGSGRGGRGGGGGLYSDRRRDLDSIASESDHESDSSSDSDSSSHTSGGGDSHSSSGTSDSRSSRSSETSMERNPTRGKYPGGGSGNSGSSSRPMGQPRVGFHDDDDHQLNHQAHHQRHYHRQYHQPESPSDTGSYEREDDNVQRLPNDRQRRGGGGVGPPPRSRSRSPTMPTKYYANGKKKGAEQVYEEERKQQRRKKLKIAMIPIAIVLVVVAIIAVVVTIKNNGKENEENEQFSTNIDSTDEYQISIPTSTPTYSGLYDCPLGKSGAVPIRGCTGFVVCNTLGEAIEPIQYCGQGTLYDVYTRVCNHVDSVVCSTPSLPPAMASSLSPGLTPPTTPAPAPTTTTTTIDTATDSAPSSATTVTLKPTYPGDLLGPTVTNDQRLEFLGVSSPGDVTILQITLQNYLNTFYSSNNLDTLDEDDVLRSLSDVSISLAVTDFENRKRRSILDDEAVGKADAKERINGNTGEQSKIRGRQRDRQLQTTNDNIVIPHFIAIYDQTTLYRTTDTSISIETILSRPFDAEYTAILVDQLQQRDPNTFSSLTGIDFVGSNDDADGTSNAVATDAPMATVPRTKRPSLAPTTTIDEKEEVFTLAPSQEKSSPPPTSQPVADTPSTGIMLTGITWLDENENGIYETNIDSLLDGIFVNLRICEGNEWKATTKSNSTGDFSFDVNEAGEYYLDFYKPSPLEQYDFTIPQVGADDTEILDSDVVEKKDESQGRTNCMSVKEGFSQLTNAGYIGISSSTGASQTPPPSPAPVTGSTAPQYCAFVTSNGSGGDQQFDFDGCSSPCSNPDRVCPDGMLCAFTTDC